MPPKKKPDKKKEAEEVPAGYNTAIMDLDQLKQYARLLEGEIEDMRKHCNFYQKMEDELVEMLRITEDELKCSEDTILSKDVEIERLKLKLLKQLKEKRQWPGYMEYAGSVKEEKLSQETSSKLEQEEARHLQETKRLKQILQEEDRKLEALRVKIEMVRKETQEKNEEYLKAMQDHQRSLLEEALGKFNSGSEEAHREFVEAREAIEFEAREGKISGERRLNEACANFKRKLHEYYKEVTRQDLDTIKKLKQDIRRVEENIERSRLLLKQAREENNTLQTTPQPRFPRSGFSQIFAKHEANEVKMTQAFRMHNRMEKLTLENQDLERQVEAVIEETLNLRKQFTLALKKVRDSAEMKAAVLERKLNAILDGNRNEPSASDETAHSPRPEKSADLETASNDRP